MTERADVSQVPRKSGVRLARGCGAVVERTLIFLLSHLLMFRLYTIIRNNPLRFTLYRSDGPWPIVSVGMRLPIAVVRTAPWSSLDCLLLRIGILNALFLQTRRYHQARELSNTRVFAENFPSRTVLRTRCHGAGAPRRRGGRALTSALPAKRCRILRLPGRDRPGAAVSAAQRERASSDA